MRKRNTILVLATVVMMAACNQGGEAPTGQAYGETVILAIKGMNCSACPEAVQASLEEGAGVQTVEMDFKQGTAKVAYVPGETSPEMLVKSVISSGVFEATVKYSSKAITEVTPE